MRMMIAIAAAAMLASCGGGADQKQPDQSAPIPDATDNVTNYTAAVDALSEEARNGVFIRAIRDAGLDCQGVTESERMAGQANMWRARCTDGANHLVQINADGTANVVSRAGAK